MPITLEYTWEETLENIVIRVNIRGVSRKYLDIDITDNYVKVNSPPHFLMVDLKEEIDYENSAKPIYEQHCLIIQVKKKNKGIWGELQIISEDHELKRKRREESKKRYEDKMKDKRKKLEEDKKKIGKDLFLESWEKEKEFNRKISEVKNKESTSMREELNNWKKKVDDDEKDSKSIFKGIFPDPPKLDNSEIFSSTSEIKKDSNSIPIRSSSGPVKVRFTPRQLPHFAREDKDREILKKYEIWKGKHKPDKVLEDPSWMKKKGDRFFRRGDYDAAINAYTAALSIREDFLEALANRSACYLKIEEFRNSISDCFEFIKIFEMKLMKKQIWNDSEKQKMTGIYKKMLCRRGYAFLRIGKLEIALKDYENVIKLEKENNIKKELIEDHKAMRKLVENPDNSKNFEEMKKFGDDLFIYGKYQESAKIYSNLMDRVGLENNKKSVGKNYYLYLRLLANRSTCYLKLEQFANSIADSTEVILSVENFRNLERLNENKKRKLIDSKIEKLLNTLLLKCLLRRGAAFCGVGEFQSAYDDYEQSFRMVPSDLQIEHDLVEISKRLKTQLQSEWLKNRANYFYKEKDYKSAIISYSKAIEADKTNVVYYANRSQCFMMMKKYIEVVRDVNVAFSVVPTNVREKQEKEIKRKKAREKLKMEQKKLENAEVKNILRDEAAEKLKNTMAEFDTIIYNTDMTPAIQYKLYMRRATAFEKLWELESAKKDYESALMIHPNNRVAIESLVNIENLIKKGMKEKKENEEEDEDSGNNQEVSSEKIENMNILDKEEALKTEIEK